LWEYCDISYNDLMDIKKLIEELNNYINLKYKDFKGTYLFGSRAKGSFNEDSDVDIVVVFDELNRDKEFDIYGIISDLMYKYDAFIDIHLMTPEKLRQNPFFYEEVVDKGIFYEAA